MKFVISPKKKDIKNLLESFSIPTFLQSENWAEFQKNLGRKVIPIGVYKDDKLILFGRGILHSLFFLKYLYFPRGPLVRRDFQEDESLWKFFLKELKKFSKGKFFLIKIEPYQNTKKEFFENLGLKFKGYIQYPETVLLNLKFSLDEILKEMHYKTRYNIKLSYKKGLKTVVYENFDKKIFGKFYFLLKKTSKEKKFKIFPKRYYEMMFKTLMPLSNIKLFAVFLNQKFIGANIVYFYKNTAYYLHGAIDKNYANLMASYQLQWSAIKYAKEKGFLWYDFGGIMKNKKINKSWEGFTRFKLGFVSEKTGKFLEWPGVFEFPINDKLYRAVNLLRKIKRLV